MTTSDPNQGSRPLIEACVADNDDLALVVGTGVDRLELCRDLSTGGLTPDSSWVGSVRDRTDLPLMVMIRPEPGPFYLSTGALTGVIQSMRQLADVGATGFVFGALTTLGTVDPDAVRELVAAAEGRPVTFHRAFDEVVDPFEALETLAELGINRILTGGGPGSAWEGRNVLAELQARAAGRIGILAAGAVRAEHAAALVEATGVTEVHARASAIPALVTAFQWGGERL